MEEIVIESCHSTWIIDRENSRFRRVVKSAHRTSTPVATEWQPCYGVEATSELSLRDLRSAVRS